MSNEAQEAMQEVSKEAGEGTESRAQEKIEAMDATSGGEVWTREMIADVHKRGEELFQRINPPPAASVSERARELGEPVMTEQEAFKLFKPIRRVMGKLHAEIGWYADEYTTPAEESIDAIEQALTQQREVVDWKHDAESWGDALNEAAWVFVEQCPEKSALLFNNTKAPLRAAILKYAELVGATTPQPSADAVRELVRRAYEVVHHDDECPAIGGCGDKDCRCDAVPFLRELESLLSGGSHA